jgi:hypothetical protein
MLTIFGACAVTFMMLMYAFERRDRRFILAFAFGCALSSVTASSRGLGRSVSLRRFGRPSRYAATFRRHIVFGARRLGSRQATRVLPYFIAGIALAGCCPPASPADAIPKLVAIGLVGMCRPTVIMSD